MTTYSIYYAKLNIQSIGMDIKGESHCNAAHKRIILFHVFGMDRTHEKSCNRRVSLMFFVHILIFKRYSLSKI